MLICNNCSHVNDDGVLQCGHCRMRGNFTYRKLGERRSDELREKREAALCLNCGSSSPGEEERCVHCNFPRAAFSPHKKSEAKVFPRSRPEDNHLPEE